jgi:hypothetical protein
MQDGYRLHKGHNSGSEGGYVCEESGVLYKQHTGETFEVKKIRCVAGDMKRNSLDTARSFPDKLYKVYSAVRRREYRHRIPSV